MAMKSATATSVVSVGGPKRYNKIPLFAAVLAVSLTAAGLGVGLSQHKTLAAGAQQSAGFVLISGHGSLADSGSYLSGGLSFPSPLPLKVHDPSVYAFSRYDVDSLTPKPTYTIERVNSGNSSSGLVAGTEITDNAKLLARLRAGEAFNATYIVVRKADKSPAYDFVVSYTVASMKLTIANQSLYDTVSFSFDSLAERNAAILPIIDVQVDGDAPGQYIAPAYKDAANNTITSTDQLRALPSGSTFTAVYKATRTINGNAREFTFVTTYVVFNNY